MGKKHRQRERYRLNAEHAFVEHLAAHSWEQRQRVRAVADFESFALRRREVLLPFVQHALRAPAAWRCAIKSRDEDRRFIDLVRFVFAKYAAPAHFEQVWIAEPHYQFGRDIAPNDRVAGVGTDLRAWHLALVQGRSLHKEHTQAFFTRAETHHLIAAPDVGGIRRAFWYAVARAQADANVARLVARSKLVRRSIACDFWREVARFFARNPVPVREMDDLIDYLAASRGADDSYSLKGRTIETLRRRMEQWHRALRRQKILAGGEWDGHPLHDAVYEAGSEGDRAIWRFRQIRTGDELFQEGLRMHHCVVTYKDDCISGESSIWSLTSEYPIGRRNRGVTIELRNDGRIVQCRGFANRLPYANEVAICRRWAEDWGLSWKAPGG